jgi:DNA-binding transcriptional LysR family regulator
MPLPADDLRFFVRLMEAGGISDAARRLHSSPPAVSRRLAALEAELGVRLVERSSRRFVPTEEGSFLHEKALGIVAEIDELEAELSTKRGEVGGSLRIGAPMEIGRRRIAPLLGDFQQRHPKVRCELVLSDAGLDPARNDLDFVFRTTLPDDPGAVCVTLLRSRRVACASPTYFGCKGVPVTPEELAGHDCLRLVRGRRVFDRWRFQRDGSPIEVHVDGALCSTSGEVIHGWALEGRGLALKAEWDIADDLRAGRLVECLEEYAVDELRLYGVSTARARQPLRLRALIDFMRAQLMATGSGYAPEPLALSR